MKVIPLSRANNISIMLTQFAGFKRGPQDIRRALVTGSKSLGTERLSLLLQACPLLLSGAAEFSDAEELQDWEGGFAISATNDFCLLEVTCRRAFALHMCCDADICLPAECMISCTVVKSSMKGLRSCGPCGMQIAPKEEEVKALAKYTGASGTLSQPEAFLATMASIPRLMDKINLLILVQQFEVRRMLRHGVGPAWSLERAACRIRLPRMF